MAHNLWLVKNNTMTNITPLLGNLSWSSDIETLGQQLLFNTSFNDDRFFPKNPIDVGDMVVLQNQSEIFRGFVVKDERGERFSRSYVSFDPAFYLNRSKEIIQFNNVKADLAIKQLLTRFGVPIGQIVAIPAIIKKIFHAPVSEIIKEILSMAEKTLGIKYRMEMRSNKLYIEKQQDLIVKGTFQLALNLAPSDLQTSISNPTRTISIEDMKNSIKIVSDDKVIAQITNQSLIDKYGLLQETETVDKKDIAQAKNIAKNMLSQLGRVMEDISFDMLGHDDVRSGRLMEIYEPITGMAGKYLIKSVTHTLEKGIHKMSLNLGVA